MDEQIKALREELQQAIAGARSIKDKVDAGGDNGVKQEQLVSATDAINTLAAQIETLEKTAANLGSMSAGRKTAVALTTGEVSADREAADHWIRGQATKEDLAHIDRASYTGENIVGRMRDANGQVLSAAMAVDSSTGHYIVLPPTMAGELLTMVKDVDPMEQICMTDTIEGDAWEQVTVTSGASAGRTAERGTRPGTETPKFGKDRIDLHGYYAYPTLTMKQVYMSRFDVVSFLNRETRDGIGQILADDYLNGTGVGMPHGLLANATLRTNALVSGHASSIVSFDPLLKLTANIKEQYLSNARWMARRSTVVSLVLLKGGDGKYLWQPALTQGTPDLLMGYPVTYNAFMPAVGADAYPIAFGNFYEGYHIVSNTLVMSLRDEITSPGFVKFYTELQKGGNVRRTDALALLKIAAA